MLFKLLGSFVAALSGWIWCVLAFMVTDFIQRDDPIEWSGLGLISIVVGIIVFSVWLLALIPLYFLVPRTSVLWRWPVCALCGGIAGGLIICGLAMLDKADHSFSEIFSWESVIFILIYPVSTGSIICLVGALTARYFFDKARLAAENAKNAH